MADRRQPGTWYTVLTFGSYGNAKLPPRGPWTTPTEALIAINAWRTRTGYEAGSIIAATSARLAGPFPTRAAARDADISDDCPIVRSL